MAYSVKKTPKLCTGQIGLPLDGLHRGIPSRLLTGMQLLNKRRSTKSEFSRHDGIKVWEPYKKISYPLISTRSDERVSLFFKKVLQYIYERWGDPHSTSSFLILSSALLLILP